MKNDKNFGRLGFGGKSLLITGGDTGIGAATSKLAARRGAKIMIASLNEETMKKTSEEIIAEGGDCRWMVCDIRDLEQVRRAVQATVDAYGSLDLAFNNAGIAHGPIKTHEIEEALWQKVVDVNITGTFFCCQAEIQQFLKQGNGGNIVVTGSMAGIAGVGRMIPYSASKHANAGMVKSLAVEYGSMGIRVNFLGPGATDTGMMENAIKDVMEFRKANPNDKMLSKIQGPLNRNQTPEEQAEVACFLLSDASSGMTGATVIVDCGATAY